MHMNMNMRTHPRPPLSRRAVTACASAHLEQLEQDMWARGGKVLSTGSPMDFVIPAGKPRSLGPYQQFPISMIPRTHSTMLRSNQRKCCIRDNSGKHSRRFTQVARRWRLGMSRNGRTNTHANP